SDGTTYGTASDATTWTAATNDGRCCLMARVMTEAEARFLMHTIKDPMIRFYLDNQADAGYDMRNTLAHLPVCPNCESAALHNQHGIICPSCGYKGAAAHKMREHINQQLFR